MRIPGNQTNLSQVNPYSAAAERAISAERAAAVRKKLSNASVTFAGPCSPTEAFNLAGWMDSQTSRMKPSDSAGKSLAGRPPDSR